jgi:hypothetical protein
LPSHREKTIGKYTGKKNHRVRAVSCMILKRQIAVSRSERNRKRAAWKETVFGNASLKWKETPMICPTASGLADFSLTRWIFQKCSQSGSFRKNRYILSIYKALVTFFPCDLLKNTRTFG